MANSSGAKNSIIVRIILLVAMAFLIAVVPMPAVGANTDGIKIEPDEIISDPAELDPAYGAIDSAYFEYGPPFESMLYRDIKGYYVFRDGATRRWIIGSVIIPGTVLSEQFHGSVVVDMEQEPTPGVNVWPLGFALFDDLRKNDRWGWVQIPSDGPAHRYEIWWDITIDYARLENPDDICDTIGIAIACCPQDFNIWATGTISAFSADQVRLGRDRIYLSSLPVFYDGESGISDIYQAGLPASERNITSFSPTVFPGASYNVNGKILPGTPYGDRYGGSRHYDGNGLQFSTLTCPPNSPPLFDPPLAADKYRIVCLDGAVYDTIRAIDPDAGDVVTLDLLSGPGVLTGQPGNPARGDYTFTPNAPGQYTAIFKASDLQGLFVIDTVTYHVTFNQPPTLIVNDTSFASCWNKTQKCWNIIASDPDLAPLTYSLVSGPGYIDSQTGLYCFTPDTSADYLVKVSVHDGCQADTAEFRLTVEIGSLPVVNGYDSIIYRCDLDSVCFDITASDPDAGDSLVLTFLDGPGIFTQTGSGIGRQCFLPDNVDSARYVFVYYVTDDCWRGELDKEALWVPTDSVVIIVLNDQPPVITCPEPQNFNLCAPGTVCLPISVQPAGTALEVLGVGRLVNGQICHDVSETGIYTDTVIASGDCGADTCIVVFDVTIGTPPEITCLPPQSKTLCGPDSIKIPITTSAGAIVTVESPAIYQNGEIVFYADREGEYCFTVRASADCGTDSCDVCVTVLFDRPPQVDLRDTTLTLCAPQRICLPVAYSDDGTIASIHVEPSGYQILNDSICFTPEASGEFFFTVTVTDNCGHSVSDAAKITVDINQPPQVTVGDDAVFLCEPATVCLPVTFSDPDNIIPNLTITPPAYYDAQSGQACLDVTQPGRYMIFATVSDECGSAVDSGYVTVAWNTAPVVAAPNVSIISACAPKEICVGPFSITDLDNNVVDTELIAPAGQFQNGQFCFTPQSEGDYLIILRATDACGAISVDSITVSFRLNEEVTINCPTGIQARNLCNPQTLCFDIPIQPSNAVVTVTGSSGEYQNGRLCFDANASGRYQFTITAATDCDTASCELIVDVTLGVPPQLTCSAPDTIRLCGPGQIRVPIDVTPASAEVVVMPQGSYEGGAVVYDVTQPGQYCFSVRATTDCGVSNCAFCITVLFDTPPQVNVPDSSVSLCTINEICLPVKYSDSGDNIVSIEVAPSQYQLIDGTICFTPESAGQFQFAVTVTDQCGNQTSDGGIVTVTLNQPPQITVSDDIVFLCEPREVCLPVVINDFENAIDSVIVSAPAQYNAQAGTVCMMVTASGVYPITVTVYDNCGQTSTDAGVITAMLNHAPTVSFGTFQATDTLCQLQEICIPINFADVDDNLALITAETNCGGQVRFNQANNTICWTPAAFGSCQITVHATDICGASASASTMIVIVQGEISELICQRDTTIRLCEPKEVCFPISGIGGTVSVSPGFVAYNEQNHTVCYTVDRSRVDTIIVKDSTACEVRSCSFIVTAIFNRPPVIQVETPPSSIACDSTLLCIPINVTDPDNNIKTVTVESDCPGAYYDGARHELCLPVNGAIDCTIHIVAADSCNLADTADVPIRMRGNHLPEITFPHIQAVSRCAADTGEIVIENICVTDADYDDLVLALDSGLGTFIFDPITYCGTLRFKPPTNDSARYCFRFATTDVCETVRDTYCLTILPVAVCSSCVNIKIDGGPCVNTGGLASVDIRVKTFSEISGFDLLILYDQTGLTFLSASIGESISGWEYFTFRHGAQGNCDGACPDGIVRVVGIAETQNGPFHPPVEQLLPEGVLARLEFRVSSDLNLGGRNIPVSFFWYDCGDNTFSDPSGQYLLVDQIIYNPEGTIIWDESNNITYPETRRLPNIGATDACLASGKYPPVRCVSFYNGEVCIQHPDSIDARGDLNLNGVSYEVADAVVYTNFFINGFNAFTVSIPGQMAASDINSDGRTLSVADLVYLIRVVVGDALPYPKERVITTPISAEIIATSTTATVKLHSDYDLGAILLVFEASDGAVDPPRLDAALDDLEIKSGYVDGRLRVLIYGFKQGAMIPSGTHNIVEIPTSLPGSIKLVEIELADYFGRELTAEIQHTALPSTLELSQNRPNPFNPRTSFVMALPTASEYTVSIYNITGQVVRRWSGHAEAGYHTFEWDGSDQSGSSVASGIYFYRAEVSGLQAIRKMVLLK